MRYRFGALWLVSGWLLLIGCAFAQTVPTPAQIMQLRSVGDPQISPDGRRIAYTVATPQAQGKPPLSKIWQIPVRGIAAAVSMPSTDAANDQHPRWTADGRRMLFLSTRPLPGDVTGGEQLASTQVWQQTPDARPQLLTRSAGDISAFSLSADARQIAYLALDPPTAQAAADTDAKRDAVQIERPTRFSRVWVRDLRSGQTRVLTPPGLQVHDLAWSPDGRQLALRVSDGTTLNDYWYASRVQLLRLRDGTLGTVLEPHASALPLQWSPDGRRLLYGQLGEHGMVANLIVHQLRNQRRVVLAQDWPGTLWLARWQNDSSLIGEGLQGVRGAFLRIDADSGRWKPLARPQLPYQAFTVARNGDIAYLGLRTDQPAEVWTLRAGQLAQRSSTNPQVATWTHGQLREMSWTSSRDGRSITGMLVTPPGWKAGTPLPTLVQIHGGPGAGWASGWLGSWHDWAQLLSTHGYAVLLPNPRGSEGQGAAFTELARHDWGGADFQDVLDGVDQLEREGVIDPARLAIGGWSYGGYLSAWAVTHSSRFKTAIVGAGVVDIGAMALTTDVPDYLPGYFGDPVRNRAEYDAHSPIRYVDKVHVPVLILHGQADQRVPPSQGDMLYRALKLQGATVEQVTYPRGPHWFYETEHGVDVQQRVLGWLDAQLR
ncbi:alpha/beta hydrolase family protein [Xanthomonas vesicatoria]|uniref:Peptidase S9, prolyl oligopeptidase activesite domain protein n=2 Tax=Xanthomonas vesicatoria TaxID=56460 RepID=A0AAJ0N2U0_9XANT|nr:S9 family peptidase [Xanthomonas vesicatoria]APO96509.1 S9 family peptidase [Xanthomonas vesicatoria]APP76606.1 S9 family peptidase [Xanthomonas vesicatoria ATCC 35937]EGD11226.1 dipeptidyl aminopeptidase/acylaminoacyl peptidase [Xanthomonas vesicatoria ATCC 35937]KHM90334.1 peptidase S9, prolyl oligopeptidase activesite domain protein [Xanthomonas vesicatoria]KHM93256.1 peptidase S9, prolyl oligopeptidase activesite domain protein [Xanthomonas vesicatoria]